MADVYFVKLVTGEQLLATIRGSLKGEVVTLENPLELTMSDSDGGKSFIYLSRYSPFLRDPVVKISHEHLVHIDKAFPGAETYYAASLEYVQKRSDVSFAKGVSDATDYISDAMDDEPSAKQTRAEREESGELADVLDIITGKITVH